MRRIALLLIIIAGAAYGCGDTPGYDPYGAQKDALRWQQEQDAAARWALLAGVATWGLVLGGAALGGIGLYWLAGRAWWNVRGAAKDVQLTAPDPQGQWPAPTWALLADPTLAALANARRALVAQTAAKASAHPALSHYHKEIHLAPPGMGDAPLLPAEAAPPELPGPCSLLDVLRDFTPSPDAILLGLGPGGQRITVPADDTMCHLLLAGQTGRGKSVLFRLLMTQLILAGVDVRWWDLAYADFDTKRRIDLRPLAARVTGGPVTDPAAINQFFSFLAGAELATRKARKAATGDAGPPFVVFADEWPQLIHAHPELSDPAARCLRIYRQYNGYFAVGSQDGLVETMGLNSGELGQFATRYYVGGADDTTRRRLTGSSKNPDPPGKGLVYLSAAPLAHPDVVRVPNVRNLDLYELLGWPSVPPPWGWDSPPRQSYPAGNVVDLAAYRVVPPAAPGTVAAPWEVDPERGEASTAPDPGTNAAPPEASKASTRRDQARRLLAEGTRPAEVVRVLWGLKTNTGRAADEAMAELTTWIAEWVGPDLAADNPPAEGV